MRGWQREGELLPVCSNERVGRRVHLRGTYARSLELDSLADDLLGGCIRSVRGNRCPFARDAASNTAEQGANQLHYTNRASGNIASPDLLWLLTKKGTSFTHKRIGAPVFSAEKGNLRVSLHLQAPAGDKRSVGRCADPRLNGPSTPHRTSADRPSPSSRTSTRRRTAASPTPVPSTSRPRLPATESPSSSATPPLPPSPTLRPSSRRTSRARVDARLPVPSPASRDPLLDVSTSVTYVLIRRKPSATFERRAGAERRADLLPSAYAFYHSPPPFHHFCPPLRLPSLVSSPPQAAQARASAILASQSARKEQRQRAVRGNKVEA